MSREKRYMFHDLSSYGERPEKLVSIRASSLKEAWRKFLDAEEPRWRDSFKSIEDAMGNYGDQVDVAQVKSIVSIE